MPRSRFRKNQLLWRCRQGTLELDTLLVRFVERRFDSLSEQERRVLSDLLERQHGELNAWLVDGVLPEDPLTASMIRKIRVDFASP